MRVKNLTRQRYTFPELPNRLSRWVLKDHRNNRPPPRIVYVYYCTKSVPTRALRQKTRKRLSIIPMQNMHKLHGSLKQ